MHDSFVLHPRRGKNVMRFIAVVVAAAACVVTAGCGSSAQTGSSTQTPAPAPARTPTPESTPRPLSHSEFIAKVNATCAALPASEALVDRVRILYGEGAYARAADTFSRWIELAEPRWARQRRLAGAVPARDASAYKRYLAAQRSFQGAARRVPKATRAGDSDTVTFLIDAMNDARKKRLQAAIALGADDCGT